ncbi:MAG TPA: SDR family oxidoreductase [Longimicrobiaceae bacterium]|nr:SDR family oxidoreductase [Longimicrobiaceae bacterium]
MPERVPGTVLVVGATSALARAVAAELARGGHPLVLVARDGAEAGAVATDLALRHGVPARAVELDVLDFDAHSRVIAAVLREEGEALEGAVVAVGYLGDAERARGDFAEARRILDTNFTACVSLLTLLAEHFERRRGGFLCVVSSVAGERGRQSNYVYGAAKGGLTVFLQGLRNRLFHAGVRVVTVNPGFVDTRMTFGREGTFLVASPERVARGMVRAIRGGRDVVYLPGFWGPLMLAIRAIPERVFKRMRL